MKENMTIYKIAEELHVSPSMISRAFSDKGKVSAKKRELILQTAEKYNYSPNKLAARLSRKSVKIGVVLYVHSDYILQSIQKGIEEAYLQLKDYKVEYEVTVISAKDKRAEDCYGELARYEGYDGIIVSGFGSKKCAQLLSRLTQSTRNVVQLQNGNPEWNCLFSSKHDEEIASRMAAEFLFNCLKRADKNAVMLFTGDQESPLHANAKRSFLAACEQYSLPVLECVDMGDNADTLASLAPALLQKYAGELGGIYITSGVSLPLCRYVQESGLDVSLVTFDAYPELTEYVKRGTVSATIFQNVKRQAEVAFSELVKCLVFGEMPPSVLYTNVELIMSSNVRSLSDITP